MTVETWCLLGTSAVTALVLGRVLATGRESAILTAEHELEQERAIRHQRESVAAALEQARSDVEPL